MYNIVPLTSGNVQLPKFHLNMPRYPDPVTDAVHKMLPNTVFVLVWHIRPSSYFISNNLCLFLLLHKTPLLLVSTYLDGPWLHGFMVYNLHLTKLLTVDKI